jgi:hypothetical protein
MASSDANQADFFGEGGVDQGQAPTDPNDLPNPANPGGMSNNELLRRQLALRSATPTANINQNRVPYNAPVDQALASRAAPVSTFTAPAFQTRSSGIGSVTRDGSGNPVTVRGDLYSGESAGIESKMGTVAPGPAGTLNFTPPGMAGAAGGAGGPGLPSSSFVNQQLATSSDLTNRVLGANPTVPADKQVNVANRDALTPVIDPALERNKEVDRAFGMSQDLYNRILNAPSQVQLAGDQALSNQLSLARSARGGPGSVNDAMDQAQKAAPGLLQQTQQAAIQEEQQRNQAAQGALGIYSAVAGNVADRATAIATANQGAGLHVLDNLTTLTGQEIQFDANQTAVIGQLARDFMNNAQAFENMSVQMQIAQWDNITRTYGIDKNYDAAIKAVAASKNVGPLDALKLVLGGISALPGLAAL